MNARLKRMNREIQDCKNDKTTNITLELIDNSPFHLKGSFPGPEDTPYEGGNFEVDIVIPETYPFQPFKIEFLTKVYHPNVSSINGAICLNILQDEWCPALTLKTTLLSIQSLLHSPALDEPWEDEVGKGYYTTLGTDFDKTARYWTRVYAGGPGNNGGEEDVTSTDGEDDGVEFEMDHIEVLKRVNYSGSKCC
ncbi:hypothetical protein L218DRAFT_974886 [Marasmius fiardii PR-910]|nr:hypothetical protein L218DRAFT_974886 [Marasmius fiardii PR-910]